MKLLVAILPMILLPSCVLLENPTLTKPSRKNLSGLYLVSKTSLLAPHKKEVGAISIDLKNDGRFRMCDSGGALVHSPGESSTGSWKVVPTYGLDLGSGQCWGVQLVMKNDSVITAHCLGDDQPYGLLIWGVYLRDFEHNSYCIMRRSE